MNGSENLEDLENALTGKQRSKKRQDPESNLNDAPGWPDLEPETEVDEDEESEGVMEKIRSLAGKYNRRQLIDDFGFHRATVDKVLKKIRKEKGREAGNANGRHDTTRSNDSAIVKIGSKDVIAPESILRFLHLPYDGEVSAWRDGLLDGMNLLLLGTRLAQVATLGQAEMFKTQLDLFKAAQEASNKDMQQMFQAFVGVSEDSKQEIITALQSQNQQQAIAQSENPMLTMMQTTMANTMQPFLANILGNIFGGLTGQGTGQPQPGIQQPPEQQPPESPSVERHSIDELEQEEEE